MTLERTIANIFSLSDENWMKHSNPWSVWTRYSVLPIIVLAVWSRVWLGWWALLPIALSLLWMYFNPVFFKKPRSTNNWTSKAVLGERVYLNRDNVPIPVRHKRVPNIASGISGLGFLVAMYGLVQLSIWPAVLGTIITIVAKTWFLDRMVWIFEDMKENEEYGKWLY